MPCSQKRKKRELVLPLILLLDPLPDADICAVLDALVLWVWCIGVNVVSAAAPTIARTASVVSSVFITQTLCAAFALIVLRVKRPIKH